MADLLMRLLASVSILFQIGLLALFVATGWTVWKRWQRGKSGRIVDAEEIAEPSDVLAYASPDTPQRAEFWLDDEEAPPPPEVRAPGPTERTRRLLSTNDPFHADLLAAVLRDAGIWCHAHGNADAVGATGVPATGLYVMEADYERAKATVADAESRARASRLERGEAV